MCNYDHSRREFIKISSASLLSSALSTPLLAGNKPGDGASVDVAVYGATPAGICAAIAAKRDGASVLLISPDDHIGGLMTSGLSRTDVSGEHHIGGIAREILEEIGKRRSESKYDAQKPWDLAPSVAMDVFQEWLKNEKVPIWTEAPVTNVRKNGTDIRQLEFLDGRTVTGDVFVDASYEGDLMARANVTYFVGRESRDKYDEPHAGWHQEPKENYSKEAYRSKGRMVGGSGPLYMHNNQFGARIPARDENGGLLWGVHREAPRKPGTGDRGIQAYCFRLSVTNQPDLRAPWPKPDHYSPERYRLLLRYIKAHPGMSWHALLHLTPTSAGKFDMNASGPFTIDYVGGGWDWPEAGYRERARIVQDHEDYQKGFLWFLANDKRVPEKIRTEANRWGLCNDEFVDNGHWPPRLYIREARRMVGAYVITEDDVRNERSHPDVIGRGSFGLDSHPVQRFEAEDGAVEEEGHFGVWDFDWYQIPYRSITPKPDDCANLLAPVPLSASHVAFGSIRMEPTWMVLGHSAGSAAVMASEQNRAVQEINIRHLQKRLTDQGQRLQTTSPDQFIFKGDMEGVVIDSDEAEQVGDWTKSTSTAGFVGNGYLHDGNEKKGEKSLRYEASLPEDGRYEVRLYYPHFSNRADNTPVEVEHAGGTEQFRVNQQTKPKEGAYDSPGVFRFQASEPAVVKIGNEGTDGYVIGDAVQFVPVERK